MSVHDCMCFCGFILLVFSGIAGLIYLVSKEDKDMAYIEFENKTNGDVIKAMFPNIEINDGKGLSLVYTGIPYGELIGANIYCMKEWWNAPYKRESK